MLGENSCFAFVLGFSRVLDMLLKFHPFSMLLILLVFPYSMAKHFLVQLPRVL